MRFLRVAPLKKVLRGPKGKKRPMAVVCFPRRVVDRHYMRRALRLAYRAAEIGEVPIGAVLVRRGVVVAEGINRVERDHNGLAHAELLLLKEAGHQYGRRLTDMTLYVTLEPCVMCAGAILHARLGRLVYGADDPERGGCGSQFAIPQHTKNLHHVILRKGILSEEAKQLLQNFFQARRAQAKERNVDGGQKEHGIDDGK